MRMPPKKLKKPLKFLQGQCNFTPLVYYDGRIPGTKAIAAHGRLPLYLRLNMKQEYSKICVLVQATMLLGNIDI